MLKMFLSWIRVYSFLLCPVVLTGNDLIIFLGMLIFICLRKVCLVIIGMVFGPKRRRTRRK